MKRRSCLLGRRTRTALLSALLMTAGTCCATQAGAVVYTWIGASSNYNDGSNWTPAGPPSASADSASFTTGALGTTVTLTGAGVLTVGSWNFGVGSSYGVIIGPSQLLQFDGTGITNGVAVAITNAGVLSFNNNSTADGAGLSNGGVLNFNNASTAGQAFIVNSSTLKFNDSSTAGQAPITNNGILNFNDSSSAGTATINNNTGATLAFNGTSTASTAVIFNNGGTFSISGMSTVLSVGSLYDTAPSPGIFLLGNGALSVGGLNTNDTIYGVISGANGSLTKTGTGTLTLNGFNTYFSTTTVNAGSLIVNGEISSNATVNAGAFLGGSGTISGSINAYGTISPGNSIGSLLVNGNTTFQAGSTYRVEIDPAGNSDFMYITGAANLNGTAQIVPAAGTYTAGTVYTILTAGGISSTFNAITAPAGFSVVLSYINGAFDSVQLQLLAVPLLSIGVTPRDARQAEVADAVDELGPGNPVFDAFTGLTTRQGQDALDDLSGEHNAGVATAMAEWTSNVNAMLSSHIAGLGRAGGGNVAALANAESGMSAGGKYLGDSSVWLEAIGTTGDTDAHGSAPGQDRSSYGALAGIDVPCGDYGYFGLFGGYQRGEIDTDFEHASSDVDNYHLGAWAARRFPGKVTLSGGIGGSYGTIDTSRHVMFGGFDRTPEGDTEGYTLSGFAELGRTYELKMAAVEPFLNVSVTHSHTNDYTETGGGPANLVVGNVDLTTAATVLGARFGRVLTSGQTSLRLGALLGWQHNFGDLEGESTMRFAAGTATFDVLGSARARDAAALGLNLAADLSPGVSAYAGYDGTLSARTQDHGFKGGVKVRF